MKSYIYTTTTLAVMVSLNVNANEIRIQQSDNGELLNQVSITQSAGTGNKIEKADTSHSAGKCDFEWSYIFHC
ncbi:hypothetical protein OA7_0023115, partial [Vibrio cyclitrophicus 1F53]|uniref:hypothetical protein n=1 Tax=Vibrio cyclitrophicus TaxID=47951 RepID=UPI0038A0D491